jgi:hypothetical protein
MLKKLIPTGLALLLIIACGSSKPMKINKELAEIHKQSIITKTKHDKRPKWCTKEIYWEKGDKMYYSGGYIGGVDYSLSVRLAKSEAIKNLIESTSLKAYEEFSHTIEGTGMGPDDINRYVIDSVAWTVENLKFSGIKQKELYFEEVFDPIAMKPMYNIWVLLEISRTDYLKAKMSAAQKQLEKSKRDNNRDAKRKTEEILRLLNQEI